MRILADANMPLLDETFGRHGEIRRLPGRDISAQDVRDADVLLVRSVTRVDGDLLEQAPVRFVGSATIGTDHLDTGWLDAHHIAWSNAPGCNADAAAQYTLAMVLLACRRLERDPSSLHAAVIGRGNVGTRVQALLEHLGIETLANDPPLQSQGASGLVGLDQALDRDIICLHVPLTRSGPWPTWRMVDDAWLTRIRPGALLVNTARGDVAEGRALSRRLESGLLHAALDVWPGEPDIDPQLAAQAVVATPHVAGYSRDGRENGTRMIYRAFCRSFNLQASPFEDSSAGDYALQGPVSATQAVLCATGIEADDRAFRAAIHGGRSAFDTLRRDYPLRRDFAHWRIGGGDDTLLRALGFRTG